MTFSFVKNSIETIWVIIFRYFTLKFAIYSGGNKLACRLWSNQCHFCIKKMWRKRRGKNIDLLLFIFLFIFFIFFSLPQQYILSCWCFINKHNTQGRKNWTVDIFFRNQILDFLCFNPINNLSWKLIILDSDKKKETIELHKIKIKVTNVNVGFFRHTL